MYDQFTTILSLNPNEYDNNNIAQNIFNYYVNDKYLTLSYDVDSKINSDVEYKIERLTKDGNVEVTSDIWEDVNYMGQNVAIIEYDSIKGFDKEDVY